MLAPEVFRKFTERTGLELCEGYGQTETTLLMANFKGYDVVEGSMGTLSPFYNIELRGKNGKPVDIYEIGEVVIIPEKTGKQPVYLLHIWTMRNSIVMFGVTVYIIRVMLLTWTKMEDIGSMAALMILSRPAVSE